MKLGLSVFALVIGFSLQSFASRSCDEETTFRALGGRELVSCSINGERARLRYQSLAAGEVKLTDEDGGPHGGFSKTDTYTSCYASAQRLSYRCSITLDANTRAQLPLNVAIGTMVVQPAARTCALTNGSDICSATIPCCEPTDVCTSDGSGTGLCD